MSLLTGQPPLTRDAAEVAVKAWLHLRDGGTLVGRRDPASGVPFVTKKLLTSGQERPLISAEQWTQIGGRLAADSTVGGQRIGHWRSVGEVRQQLVTEVVAAAMDVSPVSRSLLDDARRIDLFDLGWVDWRGVAPGYRRPSSVPQLLAGRAPQLPCTQPLGPSKFADDAPPTPVDPTGRNRSQAHDQRSITFSSEFLDAAVDRLRHQVANYRSRQASGAKTWFDLLAERVAEVADSNLHALMYTDRLGEQLRRFPAERSTTALTQRFVRAGLVFALTARWAELLAVYHDQQSPLITLTSNGSERSVHAQVRWKVSERIRLWDRVGMQLLEVEDPTPTVNAARAVVVTRVRNARERAERPREVDDAAARNSRVLFDRARVDVLADVASLFDRSRSTRLLEIGIMRASAVVQANDVLQDE